MDALSYIRHAGDEDIFQPRPARNPQIKKNLDTRKLHHVTGSWLNSLPEMLDDEPMAEGDTVVNQNGVIGYLSPSSKRMTYSVSYRGRSRPFKKARHTNGDVGYYSYGSASMKLDYQGCSSRLAMKERQRWIDEAYDALAVSA